MRVMARHHGGFRAATCSFHRPGSRLYEERKWPRRPPSTADLIRHLMDQHGLTRADCLIVITGRARCRQKERGA
jgi:antitoxin component HigA of HigAB toxin-antitoxin module